MAEAYILPTREHAQLVIAGDQPLDDALAIVRAFLGFEARVAASA